MARQRVDIPRELALKVLRRTETSLSFPKLLLDQSEARSALMEQRSKAFTYELVMGTLRRRGTLDWAIGTVCGTPIDKLTPWIRNILRIGMYQILYLGGVPKSAAVDESVKLAKKYGHAGTVGLVNAVLRNSNKEKIFAALEAMDEDQSAGIAIKYSHPAWIVEQLREDWGLEAALKIMTGNNIIAPLVARVNTLRATREELLEELARAEVSASPLAHAPEAVVLEGVSSPPKLNAHKNGRLYFQDTSSMLAAHCLDVEPGMKVLDTCAGPGGKSTHLAALMNNEGVVYALDLHEHRVELIDENAQRLGVKIVEARLGDATKDLAQAYAGMDRVLVDAPCSGLGVARRRVDLKWRLRPERIEEVAQLQTAILERAAACVKSGGILVYSTCTVTRRENDMVVDKFLRAHPEFKIDAGLPETAPKIMKSFATEEGFVRIFPGDEGMDGFFIARLRRM
jgi:16S rRNA (cytosine967-C5)-methyltransferase